MFQLKKTFHQKNMKWHARLVFFLILISSFSMIMADAFFRVQGIGKYKQSSGTKVKITRKLNPPAPYTPEGYAKKIKEMRGKTAY